MHAMQTVGALLLTVLLPGVVGAQTATLVENLEDLSRDEGHQAARTVPQR